MALPQLDGDVQDWLAVALRIIQGLQSSGS
jgi:hypothetical protein